MNNLRIAWLLPTAWYYWQPLMSEFTKLFPNTKVFTALFPGFAKGLQDSIQLQVVGQQKKVEFKPETTSYSSHITYLSPLILVNLLQFKPQIIFSSSFGIWTILALLFKPIAKWKVVIAYEGSSPSVDYRNSSLRLAIRRIMVKSSDVCISNSHAGKDYLIKYLNAKPDYTFARPYEVPDVNSWSQLSLTKKQKIDSLKKPIFLFVGKITPRKGLNFLLEACVLLEKQKICDYTILVIGDGEQRKELTAFVREHSIDDHVQWLGQIDYDELGNYFHAADVFILPTLEDTWGMVVLEAMLCGKPILCSTEAGASEFVSEGKNGFSFHPQDIELLAKYMMEFIQNSSLSVAMGNESLRIIAQHNPEKAAVFLEQIVTVITKENL